MNPSIKFKITHGTTNPSEYEASFKGVAIKIGTSPGSHIRLSDDDGRVSRMHAVVDLLHEEGVSIIDLGSASGTRIGGKKISKAPLHVGSVIAIGLYELMVLEIEVPGAERTPDSIGVAPAPAATEDPRLSVEILAASSTATVIATLAALTVRMASSASPRVEEIYQRVANEVNRRLPGPLEPAAPATPHGDVDDELAMALGVLEVAARAFAFFRDGDQDIGTVREELRKAAVAYAKTEQRFGVAVMQALRS